MEGKYAALEFCRPETDLCRVRVTLVLPHPPALLPAHSHRDPGKLQAALRNQAGILAFASFEIYLIFRKRSGT